MESLKLSNGIDLRVYGRFLLNVHLEDAGGNSRRLDMKKHKFNRVFATHSQAAGAGIILGKYRNMQAISHC
jgi:hypothetical protein